MQKGKFISFIITGIMALVGMAGFINPVFANNNTVCANDDNTVIYSQYIEKLGENENRLDKDDIVLIIDGTEITREKFENNRAFLSIGGNRANDQQVIDNLLRNEVVYNEAVRRGLEVSLEEAKDFSMETLTGIMEMENGLESIQLVVMNAQRLNMTLEEYFMSANAIRAYQKTLTQGKLRAQIYEAIAIDMDMPYDRKYPSQKIHKLHERQEEEYNKLVENLKEKAIIKIKNL